VLKIISLKNSYLGKCLFFRHGCEKGQIQGKFHAGGIFLTELSTETGDRFAIALGLATLQPGRESMSLIGKLERDADWQ
jgi:hypothetical protein